jgi:CheY-like chemotaxis protein
MRAAATGLMIALIPKPPKPMKTALKSRLTPSLRKSSARVLLVEDQEAVRKMFASALTRTGYDTETAGDGAEALERIAGRRFDLVVTDWEMPVLDGGRLVLALRSARLRMPVVMLLDAFGRNALPRAIAREVFAAMEKPVCIFTFLATIAAALESAMQPLPHAN